MTATFCMCQSLHYLLTIGQRNCMGVNDHECHGRSHCCQSDDRHILLHQVCIPDLTDLYLAGLL